MKLGVMIIWTISEKKFCCHRKLPGGIQIFWPLFRDLSIDFIYYVKSFHFSCGGNTLTGILMPWLIALLAITFISRSHHVNYASLIFMSLYSVCIGLDNDS